ARGQGALARRGGAGAEVPGRAARPVPRAARAPAAGAGAGVEVPAGRPGVGAGEGLMPEWLQWLPEVLAWLGKALCHVDNVSWGVLTARLVAAFVLGCIAAGIYALTTRGAGRESLRPLAATLVLLSVLMAVVTQVTGDNLARAFGLVGALSIVRFRTIVEDTRDTAFVIFAVVVGMAAGAGQGLPARLLSPLGLLGAAA